MDSLDKDLGGDAFGYDKDVATEPHTVVTAVVNDNEYGTESTKETKRNLKPRHIQLLAISGGIGTGLFIGIGTSLEHAGPIGLLLGYFSYGLLVLSTFNAMGELVCYLPVDGSFIHFAKRFVDPSFAFALGWVYLYSGATVVAAEASAIAGLIDFWSDSINSAVWCAVAVVIMTTLNVVGVKYYGEGEFYLSLFKVLLIIGISLFTLIAMCGGNPAHDAFGFRYWKNPGPFAEYIATGGTGRFVGWWSTLLQAAYAFGGPDYLSNLAAEAKNPRVTMPNMFRRVIYRLLTFYGLGALCAGILVPYNDPNLGLALPGAGSSPFVLGAVRLGIPVLPSIINALLLTSVLSCGAEISFAVSRALYGMALAGNAPKFFTITKRGVPIYAVLAINAVGCLSFLSASNSASTVFSWITNICGSAGLLTQVMLHVIYIRWWRATKAQGTDRSKLPFARRGQIYVSWIVMFAFVVVLLGNGFAVFVDGSWSVSSFLFAYISIPAFLIPLIGHKVYMRTFWAPKLVDVDLYSGVDEIEALAEHEVVDNSRMGKVKKAIWG